MSEAEQQPEPQDNNGEERQQEDPKHDDGEEREVAGDAAEGAAHPGWPEVDPAAVQTRSFMTAGDVPGGQLAVTARGGKIQKRGAPAGLFSDLTEHIGDVLKDVGNMIFPPLVLRAQATRSMTIVFGDVEVDDPQVEIPYNATQESGRRVADLIERTGDDLFAHAIRLGVGAEQYVALTNFVQSEGIALEWEARGDRPRTLTPERAAGQYERLSAPPRVREWPLTIDGLLYRVIYERPGEGKIGIRLSKQSPMPPRHQGRTVIVRYEDEQVERVILNGLVGQPVIAHVVVSENTPGSSVLQTAPPHPVVKEIYPGQRYERLDLWEDDETSDDLDT